MPFAISDEFLPAVLTAGPMTDQAFAELCAEHPDLTFEMTAEGKLIVMAPTYSVTGSQGFNISGELYIWAKHDGRGSGFDSSTGFVLPNGARRSPDASWTLNSRIDALDPASRATFYHLCPDFVIELRSKSDRLRTLEEKLEEYIANGAQLGWLIDPETHSVTIYRPNGDVETRTEINSIAGEGLVATFTLDLSLIWNPRNRPAI